MDGDIQTTMVSIVKEEDDVEIKDEPMDDYGHQSREGRFGALGHFYQVECSALPIECLLEEEQQQKNGKGCSCSKELGRLEARMNRLECLLELLASKVATSPLKVVPQSTPTPAISKENVQPSATRSNDAPKATIPLPSTQVASNLRSETDALKAAAPLPSIRVASNLISETRNLNSETSNSELPTDAERRKGKSVLVPLPALVKAAHSGHLLAVQCLLRNRPDVKVVGEALHMAGCPSVVEALCDAYPEIIQGVYASRALFFAADLGRVTVLRALLEAGADPNAMNRNTLTVLHKAASKGHLSCVNALLNCGADVTTTTSSRWTALHMAAMNGGTDCLSSLMEAGADIEANDRSGCTPLHYAARWNHSDAVRLLLNAGACRSAKNNRGKTPLDLASTEETVQLLTQQTPLDCFVSTGQKEVDIPVCKRLKQSPEIVNDHNYSASVHQT